MNKDNYCPEKSEKVSQTSKAFQLELESKIILPYKEKRMRNGGLCRKCSMCTKCHRFTFLLTEKDNSA